ncbi:hypothetical protein [Deinococcus phoenicis]|nr:hypothetical protein [Deinococcus phoenicis]
MSEQMMFKTPDEMCEHMRWLGDEVKLIRWGQTSFTDHTKVMPVIDSPRSRRSAPYCPVYYCPVCGESNLKPLAPQEAR